jgi:hypothetical protein
MGDPVRPAPAIGGTGPARSVVAVDVSGSMREALEHPDFGMTLGGAYDRFQQAKRGENSYTIQDYDYASLKLCLLSILWKMSISNRDSYKGVALGPFEATIRQMLLDKTPGRADEFPMFIYRLVGELDSSMIRPTVLFKDEGVNVYELGLPGYVAFIKVDKRPPPRPVRERVLARGKPLIIGVTRSPLTLAKISELLSHPGRRHRK